MALLRHAGGRVVRGGGPRGTGAPDNLMLSPWRNPQQLDEFSAFLGRLRRVAVVLCCVPSPVGCHFGLSAMSMSMSMSMSMWCAG